MTDNASTMCEYRWVSSRSEEHFSKCLIIIKKKNGAHNFYSPLQFKYLFYLLMFFCFAFSKHAIQSESEHLLVREDVTFGLFILLPQCEAELLMSLSA